MNFLKKIKVAKVPLSRIPRKVYSHNPPFTQGETTAIDVEISKHFRKGVINPSIREQGLYISPTFVTIENDGGYRLILNLKNLNENIEHNHFQMHGLK